MSVLSQVQAVTATNLRTIPQRLGASVVVVVGSAGVVAVLVSVLAMYTGFQKIMRSTGHDDRAIVLRAGAAAETTSSITREVVDLVTDAPGIRHDAKGQPIYSAESLTVLLATKKDGTEGSLTLRGVGSNAFALRPEIKLVAGRMFEPTLNEVIVGKAAQELYRNLNIGSEIRGRNATWKVVGVFESSGDAHESEIITSNVMLQTALNRVGRWQVVTAQLESPEAFAQFKRALTSNPNVSVDVMTEREYFAQQSQTVGHVLNVVARVVGGIMAFGAIFGAFNSMYSAISKRTIEIATLRAIGFGTGAIVTSVMIEAVMLSLAGGVVGAFLSWLFFNGDTVSTSVVGSLAPAQTRAFSLYISPVLIATGIVWASFIGLIGGLFPALHAARLPVATALRKA